MCGIAGSISNSEDKLERIKDAIKIISHRGPDETGFFLGEHCQLGIARLSIIDVIEGHQPCFNESKDIVSVFNGEIYNFRELRASLINKGHVFLTHADSELIPHLFEEYGENFPRKIQGMFAIAIYVKSKDAVYLFRDRIGKKPIWYSLQNGNFFFSSELKGLFPLGVSRNFESSTITEYLSLGYINSPRSPFKNIYQVMPGSVLEFRDGNISSREYWKLEEIQEENIAWNDALIESETLIRTAVKDRLLSERPLGVFLSGGVDSSLVAALAQKELGNLKTFSIGFLESEFDESNQAVEIARHLGTKHHTKVVTPDPMLIVHEISRILDQPFADSSIIPTYLLAKFARDEVVVALSGDGGDESFGGYDRYRFNHYTTFANPLLRINPFSSSLAANTSESRQGKFLRAMGTADSMTRATVLQANIPASTVARLIGAPLAQMPEIEKDVWCFQSNPSIVYSMQLNDFKNYLPGDLLYKVDIASMANGLEVRSPLLDYRIVEFGLSLPSKFKIAPNRNKVLLRELLGRYIPGHLINQSKKGFGIPRAKWLRGELRTLVTDTLINNNAWINNYVEQEQVKNLVRGHMNGKNYESSVWSLLMLELWASRWLSE
jgi:asparagine synthase (glutamine-hydrolysing)